MFFCVSLVFLPWALCCVQCQILDTFFTPWNICSICLKHGTSICCFVWIKRFLLTVEWRDKEVGSCNLAWSWMDERQTFQWTFCMNPGSSDSWSRVDIVRCRLEKGKHLHTCKCSLVHHSLSYWGDPVHFMGPSDPSTNLLTLYLFPVSVCLSLSVCLPVFLLS